MGESGKKGGDDQTALNAHPSRKTLATQASFSIVLSEHEFFGTFFVCCPQ